MAEKKMIRLSQASRNLNVGHNTILDFLTSKGFSVKNNPNTKLTPEQYDLLTKEFASSASEKEEALSLSIDATSPHPIEPTHSKTKGGEEEILIKNLGSADTVVKDPTPSLQKIEDKKPKLQGIKVVGKIQIGPSKKTEKEKKPSKEEKQKLKEEATPQADQSTKETIQKETPPPSKVIKASADKLQGIKVVDKIELPTKPVASSDSFTPTYGKRPRKRIQKTSVKKETRGKRYKPAASVVKKPELTEKEIQDQIRTTLAKLSTTQKKTGGSKYRKEKRQIMSEIEEERLQQEQKISKTLKVTEFISANDLASLMDNVSVNDIISTCMSLGMFVSINQRLDAELITVIADEFGYDVQFTSAESEQPIEERRIEEEDESLLQPRAPIVTIMGHVDHGKTSLIDYIRNTKVTASEAGGITQHIGPYSVETKSKQLITFLDTPGHEAFTAMRARGARLTDIAIIVVAADDDVMPQTKEAINHAQVAGVPIVIAINKVDKPSANPDKIKESLSKINVLVEDWGGKYQCQSISAKMGQGVDELLEKILLEAELLNLRANPNKPAVGSVIEASLDKGRGFLSTVMVQSGTLRIGDVVLAGHQYGKVKAMFNASGEKIIQAGPSSPVLLLGLDGAPQAGEKLLVMETDREARELASKRSQIVREQSFRTRKHITLDEIGRRLAVGSFKELNMIVKGDVDGSVEALADSLLKLSTQKVKVNILYKAVGQISESDVLLASASDAIIVGFQVRPSSSARRLAEQEEIEIRQYSIIYKAINEIKDAIEGMLDKEFEEVIVGNAEIRETFKISKVGTVAGCMITDGYVKRSNPIRLIRNGIVTYTGKLSTLKRFKDDVNEVKSGYDCGMGIENFNDIKVGDVIESYEMKEVKHKS